MPYHVRSILVPVHDAAMLQAALPRARRLAERLGATVEVLHVHAVPLGRLPTGDGVPASTLRRRMAAAEQTEDRRMEEVRALVEAATADDPAGAAVRWRVVEGAEDVALAHHGRLADLIVLSRPPGHGAAPDGALLNAALMETGRPVLLLPPAGDDLMPARIAVAWDGSLQAARALSEAMPLLAAAQAVTVLRIADSADDRLAQEAAQHLARHGVAVTARTLRVTGSVADTLRGAVIEAGADLLVMGAYGHGRLRERVLGGVTRSLLTAAPVPVLLAH